MFAYDDEDRVDLDYGTIKKFGMLEISPPTELEQIETCNKQLVSLRDALKLKGQIEQAEGTYRLTKEQTHEEKDKYDQVKAMYQDVDAETRKCVQRIFSTLKSSSSNK